MVLNNPQAFSIAVDTCAIARLVDLKTLSQSSKKERKVFLELIDILSDKYIRKKSRSLESNAWSDLNSKGI